MDNYLNSLTEEEKSEYDVALREAREREEKVPPPQVDGQDVIWYPQEGSQTEFLSCPLFEALYHGTRGPGKSDAMLWSYAQHVGKGYKEAWAGIIFRQTYKQLADIHAKSEKWFRQVFPGAKFNKTSFLWEWDTGERLLFRHINRVDDYWNYHGHEYPFIGFEELCNWATDECYTSMFACCRSSTKGVPRMIRASTNPYGPGHNWVKNRFRLDGQWWKTIVQMEPKNMEGKKERPRVAIHGYLRENKILMEADPEYEDTIISSASSPEMGKAWLTGSWDIVAGGMFGDVWKPEFNIVPKFTVPQGWRIDRSFDWGSSKPFSVGWWAESDGSDIWIDGKGWIPTVRGDIFRIYEWYGWTGKANQGIKMLATDITKGIIERELGWGIYGRVKAGPADSSIYNEENGMSIGRDMAKKVRIEGKKYKGIQWHHADKRPGSRISGWELMRQLIKNAHKEPGVPRERPGIFVVDHCDQFIRTVPSLPRDEKHMDDIDTEAEDHIADESRYRSRAVGLRVEESTTTGMY